MRAEIIFTAQACSDTDVSGKAAVVIDVLRATSVIITALFHGAASVSAFKTVEEAMAYGMDGREHKILGGERSALKIEGFDYGNSPLEYTRDAVDGKEIVLTTTNGTQAIENSLGADVLLIMSFLNVEAVAKRLMDLKKNIVFVCAGTGGKFSMEDGLCAGACLSALEECGALSEVDDAGLLLMEQFQIHQGDLYQGLKHTKHYKNLVSKGFSADVDYCLQKNKLPLVPVFHDGKIIG